MLWIGPTKDRSHWRRIDQNGGRGGGFGAEAAGC